MSDLLETTDESMYYCPECEVLLDEDNAYVHTYSHRDKGPNTMTVMDLFKEVPVAEAEYP